MTRTAGAQAAATSHPLRARRAVAALAACLLLTGCVRDFSNENDRLRARVLELERMIQLAHAERDEMRALVAESERAIAISEEHDATEYIEALPRCVGLSIGRLTGFVRRAQSAEALPLDVYLVPYDGRRRFVQAVGHLNVEALLLPPPGVEDAPRRLADVKLEPLEVRDAFRSGLTGSHYVVRLQLPPDEDYLTGSLLVRAEFFDGVTGLVHRAERPISTTGRGEHRGSNRRRGEVGDASRRP